MKECCGPRGSQTHNLLITSRTHIQLSHPGRLLNMMLFFFWTYSVLYSWTYSILFLLKKPGADPQEVRWVQLDPSLTKTSFAWEILNDKFWNYGTSLFAHLTLYIVHLIKFTSPFYYLSVCLKLLDDWQTV